ncbi:MAG: hypothetical protein ABSD76_13700 [Terriglobales bacterium]|jgi:hypothetical protein
MADSGLHGPYSLTTDEIDKNVTKTSAGAYALDKNSDGTFYVYYVGRDDKDVNDRLKDHVDEYARFKFGYYTSAKAAFEKECTLFHDFGETKKLDNKIHPARPDNSDWSCPGCDVFD